VTRNWSQVPNCTRLRTHGCARVSGWGNVVWTPGRPKAVGVRRVTHTGPHRACETSVSRVGYRQQHKEDDGTCSLRCSLVGHPRLWRCAALRPGQGVTAQRWPGLRLAMHIAAQRLSVEGWPTLDAAQPRTPHCRVSAWVCMKGGQQLGKRTVVTSRCNFGTSLLVYPAGAFCFALAQRH
jgi:hypothetical protein